MRLPEAVVADPTVTGTAGPVQGCPIEVRVQDCPTQMQVQDCPTKIQVQDCPRVRSGKALSESYRMFRQGLLGFIQSRVHDPALAEDLLHEVFIKAIKALERDVTPANMPAWLYRIASNVVIDHYRSQRPTEDLPDDLEAQAPYQLPAEQTLALCLTPFIKELPELYRDTMLATAIEGRSLAELSRELGLTQSAIKSRASRGRRMLRDKVLDCCHVEVSGEGEVLDYHKREG